MIPSRVLFGVARRRLGRVSEMWRIAAQVPSLHLANLSRHRESGVFGPTENLVLDLAVGMAATPASVSDGLFAQLQQHFSNAQLVELATHIAQGHFRSRFNRVFHCQPAGLSAGAFCPPPET